MAEDIKLTFSAEMTDLLRSMKEHDRLVQDVEKGYKDAARAANNFKDSQKGFEDIGAKFKDFGKNVASIAAGFYGPQGIIEGTRMAVRLLKSEYEDMIRKGTSASQAMMSHEQKFVSTFSGWKSPDEVNPDKLKSDIEKEARRRNIPLSMVLESFSAYVGANPLVNENQALFESIRFAEAGKLGGSQAVSNLARFSGSLQQVLPGKSGDDIADIAMYIYQRSGEDYDKSINSVSNIQRLKDLGFTDDEALGITSISSGKEISKKSESALFSALKPVDRPKHRDKIDYPLSQIESASGRLEWLKSHPDLAVQKYGADILPFLQEGKIVGETIAIKKAQESDYFSESMNNWKKTNVGERIITEAEISAQKDYQMLDNPEARLAAEVRKAVNEMLESMPGITKMQRSVMSGIVDAKGAVGFDTVESNIQSIEQLAQDTTATHEYYPGYGGTIIRAKRTVTPEMESQAAALEKLAELLRQLQENFKRQEEISSQQLEEQRKTNQTLDAAAAAGGAARMD